MRAIANAQFDRRLHPHGVNHHADHQDEQDNDGTHEKRPLHFHGRET